MWGGGPQLSYRIVQNGYLTSPFRIVDVGHLSISETKWMVFGNFLAVTKPPLRSGQTAPEALRLYRDNALDHLVGWAASALRDREPFCVEVESTLAQATDDSVLADVSQSLQDIGFVRVATDYRYAPNVIETKLVSGQLVDLPVEIGSRIIFYRANPTAHVESVDELLKRIMVLEIYDQKAMARDLIKQHAHILPDGCSAETALELLGGDDSSDHRRTSPWISRLLRLTGLVSRHRAPGAIPSYSGAPPSRSR